MPKVGTLQSNLPWACKEFRFGLLLKCDGVLKPSLKATHPSLLAKETPSHGMEDENAIYIQKPMSLVAYNGESNMPR